jgi:hypothetical protein
MINTYISIAICLLASILPLIETLLVLKKLNRKLTSRSLIFIALFALSLSGLHFALGWWLIGLINNATGFYRVELLACLGGMFALHLGILISLLFLPVESRQE